MLSEIQTLLEDYEAWLRNNTSLREINDWVEVTTPYLDRHNDQLQIYVRRENGHYLLTDDGFTIADLESSGCRLDTPRRQKLLRMTVNGFGVKVSDEKLEVTATRDSFPLRKHNLIQAMLAVNDLFYLAEPVVRNLFFEDVVAWLEESDVRYSPKVKFTGLSGYDHVFDFVIPKSKRAPERLLRAITRPSRNTAEAFIHAWSDTHGVRSPESAAFAILNDREQKMPPEVPEALTAYNITPVPWTRREEVRDRLAA